MKPVWDDNDWWTQELILAYDMGREHEEMEIVRASIGGKNA